MIFRWFLLCLVRNKMITLDKLDRSLLYELDKNSRIPVAQLAKKLRHSRETIVYRLNRLVENKIITKFITTINPCKLGYEIFKIYLKLENAKDERERCIEYLKHYEKIYWICVCHGVWDLVFSVFAKDSQEFYELRNELVARFKTIIVQKEIGTFVDAYEYPKKFLIDCKSESDYVIIGGKIANNSIDEIDKKIVEVLANDARIPISILSKKLNSSPRITRNKIQKLEKLGIILRYRIDLNLQLLGLEFYKAIIYVKDLSKKKEQQLIEYTRKHPNIIYYVRSIAPWELEIECIVKNHQQFISIIEELRDVFHDVIKNYEFVIINWDAWIPSINKL